MAKKEMTYAEAMAQIEKILARFRNEEMDVDSLAAEVKRATELIAGCKSRLRKAEEEVSENTGIVMTGKIVIRETVPADLAAIVEVHKKGFGYDKEAGLTAELLSDPTAEPTVSLLALRDGEAVGHILFTRCRIAGAEVQQPLFYILAPLAVVPSCQKQGVGGLLIAEGLQLLRERGAKLVFVLGHKEYYPRHGFIPGAEKLGFPAPYPILEKHADYWMAQALTDDGFSGPKGRVVCADALNRPEHWRE